MGTANGGLVFPDAAATDMNTLTGVLLRQEFRDIVGPLLVLDLLGKVGALLLLECGCLIEQGAEPTPSLLECLGAAGALSELLDRRYILRNARDGRLLLIRSTSRTSCPHYHRGCRR